MAVKKVPMYIKNVAKSIKYSGQDFIRQQMPSTMDFVETNSEVLSAVTTDLRNYKNTYKQAKKWWNASSVMTSINEAKDNALNDLKTGNFYNKARADKAAFAASGWEDVLGGFEEEMNTALNGFDDKSIRVQENTNKSINTNTEATVGVVSAVGSSVTNMMSESANYVVENQNKIASQNMVNDYKMFNVVSNILTEMATNVRGIYEYTGQISKYFNESTNKTSSLENKIDQLLALTKETTEMQRNKYNEYNKSQDVKYHRSDDEEFLGSTFNIKNYFQTVKKRVNKEIQNSGIGGMSGMMGEGSNPLKLLASNPLSFISNAAFNKMISKEVRGSMQNLDKTVSGFFKSSMLKMSSGLRQKGQDNQAFDIINRILGVNTSDPGKMKTNLYVKGPVPWNGIAERSLTEVIPTYLRKMLAAMTGQEEMIYDFNNGKFNKITNIKKNLESDVDLSYNDVSDMKGEVSKLINNYAFSNEMQKTIDSNIDKLFKAIVDKGIFYNPEKISNDFLKDNGVFLEGGQQSFDLINSAFKSLGKDKWNQFNGDVLSAINTRHNRVADLSKNGIKAGYTGLDNGFDDQFNSETGEPKNISGILMKDKWGKNVNEYLRDIREILLDGIRVFSIGYDPNNINDNISSDDRAKKYKETMSNILNKSTVTYNKSQDDLEKEAKTKNGKIINNLDDIGLSNIGHEEFFKRMSLNKDKTEENKNSNIISQVNDSANGVLNKIFDAGKEIASVPGNVIKGVLDSVNDNLLYFLYGSKDDDGKSLLSKIVEKFTEFGSKMVTIIDSKVINPLNNVLFNKDNGIVTRINNRIQSVTDSVKDKLFNKDKGIFSKVQKGFSDVIYGTDKNPGIKDQFKNGVHDITNGFMNVLVGRDYVSKISGEKVPARQETMFSLMKDGFNSVTSFTKDTFSKYFVGKDIKNSITDSINKHTATASRVMFGSSDYSMSPKEFFTKNISPRLPKSMMGLLGGLGLSLISPLGLIGGTLMGGSMGFLSTSSKFKDTLFGKVGNNTRDKVDVAVDAVNKALPKMGVGALAGGALSLMTPFGLLGGTLLGGSIGFLSTSEKFKTWLFGNGADKQGLIKKEYYDKFKSYLPGGALGAGMGALGSFFLPGGPVGGALMGLTLGIAGQSNMVKTYLFGEEDPLTNKRQGGLFGKFKLYMQTEILMPLKTFAKQVGSKGLYFIRKELLNPILDAMSPITKEISLIKDRVIERAKEIKDGIIDKFTSMVIKPFGDTVNKYILDPMKKTFKNLFGGMFKAMKNIITAPSKMINGFGMNLMKKHMANGDAEYLDEWKEKKAKRDKSTEEKYKTEQAKIKGEKSKNKLVSNLMRKGGYDSKDPATQKAMAWMGIGVSDNVASINNNLDKNTNLLDRISNLFSDFKLSWENRNNIKHTKNTTSNLDSDNITEQPKVNNSNDIGRMKDIKKPNKEPIKQPKVTDINEYKNNKSRVINNNTEKQPSPIGIVTDQNIKNNPNFNSGDYIRTDIKNPNIPIVNDRMDKNITSIAKDVRNISSLLTNINPVNIKSNNTKTSDTDESDNSTITKSTKSNISIIKDSVDGQLNGVGYNTELIANILIDQFGMPSILPSGVRSFSHKIKSIFSKPKEWISGIFDKIMIPVNKVMDGVKAIPKAIFSAGKEAVGIATKLIGGVGNVAIETLKAVGSAIPGILDIISTTVKAAADVTVSIFKSLPSVISTLGTVIGETTKVVGTMGVQLAKSFGEGLKSATVSLGHLTVGMAKLASEAIPALFKSIAGAVGFVGSTVKSVFGMTTGMFGKKKKIDTKNMIIKTVENVRNIEVIENVKNVDKISDARIYEHMSNITTAIHSLRTGTDDIPLSVNATKLGVKDAKDKEGTKIKNNVIDITDRVKKANNKKKKETEQNNKVLNNVTELPNKNNITTPLSTTGNRQVDLFKNKEKIENATKKALIKDKLETAADTATVRTGKTIASVFKKGGILSTIGQLLIMGLPLVFNFFKNIKNKAMQFAESLLGKLLKKLPLPGIPGTGGNNTSLWKSGGKKGAETIGKTIAKDGAEIAGKNLTKEGLEIGSKKIAKEGLEIGSKKLLSGGIKGGIKRTIGSGIVTGGMQLLSGAVENTAQNTTNHVMGDMIENTAFTLADDTGEIIGKSGAKQKIGRTATKALGTIKDTGSGIISKILESGPVRKLADKIGGSGTAQALSKLGKWLTEKLAKQGGAFFSKLVTKWSVVLGAGTVTGGLVPLLWYGGTIINGISATNRMFSMAPNYKPSMAMRAIAGFASFISEAVTFGVISPDLIAQFLGTFLLSDEDVQKVNDGKEVLEQDYQNYLATSGEDISFDDYNAKKANASLMTKAWEGTKSVASSAMDAISEGWGKVKKVASENTVLSAFNDDVIRDTLGLDPNTPITMQDRLSMGTGSFLSSMTFGLVKKEGIAKTINGGIEIAKKGWNGFKDSVVNIAKNHTMFTAFNDDMVRNTMGLGPDDIITTQDRLSMASGTLISNLSFGLLKKENLASHINTGINKVKEGWNGFKDNVVNIAENHTMFTAFNDDMVRETLGLGPDDAITTQDRMSMSTGTLLSNMTFGLVKKENIANIISKSLGFVKDMWSAIGDKFKEWGKNIADGTVKLDKKIGSIFGLTNDKGESVGLSEWTTSIKNNITNTFTSASDDQVAKRNAEARQGGGGLERNAGGDSSSGTGASKINNAVYFSQNEAPWASIDYGYGKNISQAGCGPTSAAMMLSSVTGQLITPEQTSKYAIAKGHRIQGNGTGWDYFKDIGSQYGVGINQTASFDNVKNALAQGYPAVLSGKGPKPFTKGGHYVMAVGQTSDGKIIVNDPVSRERSIAYDPGTIQSATAQAWISDKKLTGGPVSSAAGDIAGTSDNSSNDSGTGNPFVDAMSQLGKITSSYVGTVIGGKEWNESMLETNKSPVSNNSTSTDGSSGSISISGYTTGSSKISDSVYALKDMVSKYANQNGIGQYTNLLLAQIMQEAGGEPHELATDPMQSAEGHGMSAGSLNNQELSIQWGTEEFANRLKDANGDVPLTLQSYNFGPGFIGYVNKNGGKMNQDLVNSFSDMQASKMGWRSYGDKKYVQNVLRYYQGGSGNENLSPSNISGIKDTMFGNSDLPEFGGNGENLEIKEPTINPSEFIYKNYKNVNDSINNTLTAQKMIREDGLDGTKINQIIELLSKISDNTGDLVDETKRNGNKLEDIKDKDFLTDSSVKQVNNVNNVNNNKQTTHDPFASLANNGASNKMSKAYEAAKQIAKGRKS